MTQEEAKRRLRDLGVSRETLERLARLETLVRKWTARINLISPDSLDSFWSRHALDSAQIARFGPLQAPLWADLGSGGGFPGLVIAAMRQAADPGLRTVLVEADQRKCAFLSTAAREMDLDLDVRARRIEAANVADCDVVSARALAPLNRLLDLATPCLAPDGRMVFPKGARAETELTSARKRWHMEVERHPSLTEANASILVIRKAVRRHEPDG